MFRLRIFRKHRRNIIAFFAITFLYLFLLAQWNTNRHGNSSTGSDNTVFYKAVEGSRFPSGLSLKSSGNVTTESTSPIVNVILIASWRSGSSFTGQMFNMHQDIFYLFEPLKFLGQEKVKQKEITKALDAMYNCDFGNELLSDWLKQTNTDVLHRVSSNALVKLCPKSITHGVNAEPCTRRIFKQCPNLTSNDVSKSCLSYPIKFFKVIKLTNIRYLETLVRKHNVKIIHLVRDPRGIHFSRKNSHDERYIKNNKLFGMFWTCQHVIDIVKLWDSETKWLLGNYKRIRFEDISLHPIESAKEIYDFLQIPFTEKIQKWIVENTIKKNQTSSKICDLKNHKLNKKSSDIAHAWRMNSNLTTVLEVQEACKEAMSMLGYINIQTEQQLRDANFSVMKSREEVGV